METDHSNTAIILAELEEGGWNDTSVSYSWAEATSLYLYKYSHYSDRWKAPFDFIIVSN